MASQVGNYGEAIKLFEKCISTYPEYQLARYNLAVSYNNLAKNFRDKGDLHSAIGMLRKSMMSYADYGPAYSNAVYLLMQLCDWKAVEALEPYLDKITDKALASGEKSPESAFVDIIRHEDPAHNLAVATSWSDDLEKQLAADRKKLAFSYKWKNKKIKIGYVGDGFRDFPTGHNLLGVLRNHDDIRFEVYIYNHGDKEKSYWEKEAAKAVTQFVDINNWRLIQTVKKIHADQIDILVDLKGYTEGGNLEIFAHRPAKVNLSWLGFPGSTGASFMDCAIVDKVVVPPRQAKYWREKLLYMPDCYRPVDMETPTEKTKLNKPRGIIFSSFNSSYKIEPVIWKAWMQILMTVPQSQLWLWRKDEEAVIHLIDEAQKTGIDPNRIVFHERWDKSKHLARISLTDIALDTRVVNGHTTTTDALRAGVPVVSIKGKHMCSRVSASCLAAAGLSELVATNVDEYVKLAVKLAKNKSLLARLKAKLTLAINNSPLFDTELFTKNLERLYQTAYLNYERKY